MQVWTWPMVYSALATAPLGALWGVPRGGQVIAGLTGRAVDTPELADVIVDDIVDSGTTRARYQHLYPEKPFWALAERRGEWVQFPWESRDTTTDLEDTVLRQLESLGEDTTREGLRGTPARVLRMLGEMTAGMRDDPQALLGTVFTEACDEMIVVRDLPFWSLCEHHLLPFHGTATMGYIPQEGRIVGLSKLPRLLHCFARRLQVQERLTTQLAQAIETYLRPVGVGVLVAAQHTCMQMRGIRSPGTMQTSCLLGAMRESAPRAEFLRLATRGMG